MPRKTISSVTVACLLLVLSSTNPFAATIRVPSEQPTIQAGIDASVDGDTVLVTDGTYTGVGNKNIDYCGKAVAVLSENGPDKTVIDCKGYGRGCYFDSAEDALSRLEGFTIRNGDVNESGGGIYCHMSSPTILNSTISGNTAGDNGGGICCWNGFSPTISNRAIIDNHSGYKGGGFSCYETSSPAILNCTVNRNSAFVAGSGIYCSSSSPIILNCIFRGDSHDEIFLFSGKPTITYSDIQGGWEGEGNIDEDPLLTLKSWFGFDYGLRTASPCIDSGDPILEDEVYDRHPLCPDWYVNGARSDMGAFGGPGNGNWLGSP